MKIQTFTLTRFAALGALILAGFSPALAGPKPQSLAVNSTANFDLENGETKDYSVSLSKGSYRLVWDAARADEKSSNIIGKVQMLKPNGVVMDSNILNFNEIAVQYRVGTVLNVPKPFVARFRIGVEQDTKNWFTVVPVNPGKRVPFGWGAKITPARIASDNGVGGVLEGNQSVYHSITLPKGKWSVSLGLKLPEDKSTNLLGQIDLLDTLGFAKKRLVNLNEIGNESRAEGIVTVLKPTPFLLRVTNNTSDMEYTYDVTIEPAS